MEHSIAERSTIEQNRNSTVVLNQLFYVRFLCLNVNTDEKQNKQNRIGLSSISFDLFANRSQQNTCSNYIQLPKSNERCSLRLSFIEI